MAKRKYKRSNKRKNEGMVYILKMKLGDDKNGELSNVYKIGVTARPYRALEARVCEIATDHYQKYRWFPHIDPRRFSSTKYYFEIEAYLHRRYKSNKYEPSRAFDGSTELFKMSDEEVDELVLHYDAVMADPLSYIEPTSDVQLTDADVANMWGHNNVEKIELIM